MITALKYSIKVHNFFKNLVIDFFKHYQENTSQWLTQNSLEGSYLSIFSRRLVKTQNLILVLILIMILAYIVIK